MGLNGELVAVEGVARDITAQTRALEAVRGGRQLAFRQVFVADVRDGRIIRLQAYEPYGPGGLVGLVLRLTRLSRRSRGLRSSGQA